MNGNPIDNVYRETTFFAVFLIISVEHSNNIIICKRRLNFVFVSGVSASSSRITTSADCIFILNKHDAAPPPVRNIIVGIRYYIYRMQYGWRNLHIITSFEDRRSEPFSRNVLSGSAPTGTGDTYKLYNVHYICI